MNPRQWWRSIDLLSREVKELREINRDLKEKLDGYWHRSILDASSYEVRAHDAEEKVKRLEERLRIIDEVTPQVVLELAKKLNQSQETKV